MKNKSRKGKESTLTLEEYQAAVERTDEKKRAIISLLGLVGEIGDLHSTYKKGLLHNQHPVFRREVAEELGDILWYVASLATRNKLSLEDIARANLVKAGQLFDTGQKTEFDRGYEEDERFPRNFSVVFEEKKVGDAVQVKICINNVYVGNGLDDNAHADDGYRYHDVFHLAYTAILGWSPVIRALLRRKRKSDDDIDRIEDGARAIFLEEAISVFVFNQAAERNYYRDINSIDTGMLKTIKKLSANLEVKQCTAKQWQEAIFQGYAMFHLLKENGGGTISVDLDARSISYTPNKKTKSTGVRNAGRTGSNVPRSVANRSQKNSSRSRRSV
ncbi:MazG-like nucleotide pyrophosphohydrolase family protein [Paucimonas lemoignei]|uniref:MazG-like nucleotide pyrophosphohydrolase family protein n=1 Tax=Paucimonas lemoignei TaxID=29443 RepID=A0A4R3HYS9_PAULE|nr:nucleoside triphosphate pyrophosphohydrolase family protein [Paucimonas lemoignei]TCS38378.1 MazG-like nucleotide pyrophosphohydrolase family protein [Paucimonas lemoignei]